MLLGPFEVGGPAGPVALGATKQRLLLALLALRANEVVSSEQLIDGLWGERPPPTALKTVHGHVARVRRILESAGMAETLITREPGYFLQVDPDCIDARTFERRAEAGRRSLAAGDAQAAERTLGTALGLWRGDALADCRRESDADCGRGRAVGRTALERDRGSRLRPARHRAPRRRHRRLGRVAAPPSTARAPLVVADDGVVPGPAPG